MTSSNRPRAVVICSTDPAGNPRPHRMLKWLAPHFELTAVCPRTRPLPEAECITLPRPPARGAWLRRIRVGLELKLGRYEPRIWQPGMRELAAKVRALRPAFIVVHDLPLLPLALEIRGPRGGGSRVLFDAREYYTRHFEDNRFWRFFLRDYQLHLARTYLHEPDVMVTVNAGLAAEYTREFGPPCGVLPSYPEPRHLEPSPTVADRVRLIHHGNAAPNRRIELMIDLMRLLPPRFTLDLMLVGMDSAYGRALRRRARDLANVAFRDPVPFAEIIGASNAYDVGLYLLPPTGFNTLHALPNKFFEFIQARLAIAIGPSVEMAPYVHRYGCGIVSEDFTPSSLATKLAALSSADIARYKLAAHVAAGELTTDHLRERVLSVALRGAGVEAFPP